ncbi:MAG: transposase [Bacillota bacterium]|jgi:hypothetical protein|nr:transposase [Bacillota bacterium]
MFSTPLVVTLNGILISTHSLSTIKYISLYLARPVIATSRIYSYNKKSVTFHYTRYEGHNLITECIPALDFIKRLIIHVLEKHFKTLCYYGLYAKHHKQEKVFCCGISWERRKFLRSTLYWRESILLTFGYDPLKCPKCDTSMLAI